MALSPPPAYASAYFNPSIYDVNYSPVTQAELALKAPIINPVFSGTVSANGGGVLGGTFAGTKTFTGSSTFTTNNVITSPQTIPLTFVDFTGAKTRNLLQNNYEITSGTGNTLYTMTAADTTIYTNFIMYGSNATLKLDEATSGVFPIGTTIFVNNTNNIGSSNVTIQTVGGSNLFYWHGANGVASFTIPPMSSIRIVRSSYNFVVSEQNSFCSPAFSGTTAYAAGSTVNFANATIQNLSSPAFSGTTTYAAGSTVNFANAAIQNLRNSVLAYSSTGSPITVYAASSASNSDVYDMYNNNNVFTINETAGPFAAGTKFVVSCTEVTVGNFIFLQFVDTSGNANRTFYNGANGVSSIKIFAGESCVVYKTANTGNIAWATFKNALSGIDTNASANPGTYVNRLTGAVNFNQPFTGSTYKKVVLFCIAFGGITSTTCTATCTFPTSFTYQPIISANNLTNSATVVVSTSGATVTAPAATATVTDGFVIIEGY